MKHQPSRPDRTGWIVFDIDGTVSDSRHRQFHIEQAEPDWPAFFGASGLDAPLPEGIELARRYTEDHRLMWLTGRPARYRAITVQWLLDHRLPARPLFMRPDRDRRPAPVFKAERLSRLAEGRDISLVVDDDDLVVATLRAAGWAVQHADWMGK